MLKSALALVCLILAPLFLFPQLTFAETVYVPVGQARAKKSVLAFPSISAAGLSGIHANTPALIHKKISDNLSFLDLFQFISPTTFIENSTTAGIAPNQFSFSDWSAIHTDFLIKAGVALNGSALTLTGYLYDVRGKTTILSKNYVGTVDEYLSIANAFSNNIVETLTGLPGIFNTRILMACEKSQLKEIYVMDFDGKNVSQITHHRSIAFAPGWHPNGKKFAYSLYVTQRNNERNINLYEYNFENNIVQLLSNRRGINSGAVYSPDGSKLALTMSFLGNPEIFLLDPSNTSVTRLTKSFGFDVDPYFSPDGNWLTYASNRSGAPMIFRQQTNNPDQSTRLTFVGRYNATPSWSMTNNKIAFASWIDNRFDIFTMNPDGSKIDRLTKNTGSNEDPDLSKDGQYIVFSSNRAGTKNIYVMNIDGTFVRRLTYGLGNCVSPRWSKN